MAAPAEPPQYAGRHSSQQIDASRAKNLDLGLSGSYYLTDTKNLGVMPPRPKGLNPSGREVKIKLNSFGVSSFPSKPVYQYDVAIGTGTEKRPLLKRVWESKTVQEKLGKGWIWDGNKIAWSMKKLPGHEVVNVDLDKDYGKQPRMKNGRPAPDEHRIAIKFTKEVNFGALRSWLSGELHDEIPLHTITFLDCLMRQTPSERYTSIKRQFFNKGSARGAPFDLGGGLQAFKGVYTSLRPAHSLVGGTTNLAVNVDVANTAFWPMVTVNKALQLLLNAPDEGAGLSQALGRGGFMLEDNVNKFKRVHVECRHRKVDGLVQSDKYTIESVHLGTDASKPITIGEGTPNRTQTTVAGYLREKHGVTLRYPGLPLLKMQSGTNTFIPMELCKIQENERYMYKLNERQTTAMLSFAVTVPAQRWGAIEEGVKMLDWARDPYLNNYGLRMNETPTVVPGKLLPNPKVVFGGAGAGASFNPGQTGRWDLRNRKFFRVKGSIKSWGVLHVGGHRSCSRDQVIAWLKLLQSQALMHGLKFEGAPYVADCANPQAIRGALEGFYTGTGNTFKSAPQLLVFVVNDKDAKNYNMIKQYCDTYRGVPSQVVQGFHVQKAQTQYCSNVLMKINAKLGGYTAEAHGQMGSKPWAKVPTMIIGADVSHGAPGSRDQQSIAALTMSWDQKCIKYTAACQVNGHRVEFINKEVINTKLRFLATMWNKELKAWPAHVIYLRDGVSDGQYAGVLEQEVKNMRKMMDELDPKGASSRKWTAIIGSKRHHVRFFPTGSKDSDRNGNAMPGTLVETGCTHPWEYDFYLCSHSALKGTARPVHYHVLLDEKKMPHDELQNMIYEASYQYVRSTTPVSQHPAMYYAHLAAARAMAHVNEAGGPLKTIMSGVAPYMWFC